MTNSVDLYHEVLTKLSDIAAVQLLIQQEQQRQGRALIQIREEQQAIREEQQSQNKALRGDMVLITSKLHDENQNTKKKLQGLPTLSSA